jgi:phosphomevalonate kinase
MEFENLQRKSKLAKTIKFEKVIGEINPLLFCHNVCLLLGDNRKKTETGVYNP